MTVLALDFGTKRVGVAISRVGLAEPLEILPNNHEILEKIYELCLTELVDTVVIGISEGTMAEKTRSFATQLQDYLKEKMQTIPKFEFYDETLSSQTARKKLKALKLSKRQSGIDHYAAAEFLSEWLQMQ